MWQDWLGSELRARIVSLGSTNEILVKYLHWNVWGNLGFQGVLVGLRELKTLLDALMAKTIIGVFSYSIKVFHMCIFQVSFLHLKYILTYSLNTAIKYQCMCENRISPWGRSTSLYVFIIVFCLLQMQRRSTLVCSCSLPSFRVDKRGKKDQQSLMLWSLTLMFNR